MNTSLNNVLAIRLAEIAEDTWQTHRVMAVRSGDGRVLQLGTGATRERWHCQADHGFGLCGEPLLTHRQAAELLGLLSEDEPVPDPRLPVVEIELLDEAVGGFLMDVLIHFSDVGREYRKAQG